MLTCVFFEFLNGSLDSEHLSQMDFNVPERITRNTPLFRCDMSDKNYNANFYLNRIIDLVFELGSDINFYIESLGSFERGVKHSLRR